MKRKFQYLALLLIVIAVIALGWLAFHEKDLSDALKRQIDNHPLPEKKVSTQTITSEETKDYKAKVEDKIKEFLNGEYQDDDIFQDDTAGHTFYSLFTPSGIKGITKDSSKKEVKERYKDIDFELYNTSAQKESNGEVTINSNIKVKMKGKEVNTGYDLFSVRMNNTGQLEGGTLYAKQGD